MWLRGQSSSWWMECFGDPPHRRTKYSMEDLKKNRLLENQQKVFQQEFLKLHWWLAVNWTETFTMNITFWRTRNNIALSLSGGIKKLHGLNMAPEPQSTSGTIGTGLMIIMKPHSVVSELKHQTLWCLKTPTWDNRATPAFCISQREAPLYPPRLS